MSRSHAMTARWSTLRNSSGDRIPNVFMKCATSLRYARLVRALLRLANHTSSSGIAANASTLTRTGAVCLDTTTARVFFSLASLPLCLDTTTFFVALFLLFFLAIFWCSLVRYNPVYHVLSIAWETGCKQPSYAHRVPHDLCNNRGTPRRAESTDKKILKGQNPTCTTPDI